MIEINQTNILDALEEAVAEKGPEYVYANEWGQSSLNEIGESSGISCNYVHGEGENLIPGCIAGNVLNRLGISLGTLTLFERSPVEDVLIGLADEGYINRVEFSVAEIIQAAQTAQDLGFSWGDALKAAKNTVPE